MEVKNSDLDAFKNGEVRNSENPPLHKSNENTSQKKVKNNFFSILENNGKLTKIQRAFLQGKWLNLGKNSKLCVIRMSPYFHAPSPALW